MLDLEIQPSNKPGDQLIFGSKVCRGFNLVDGPFVFNLIRIRNREGELGMFHRMRQLKHNTDHKTCYHAGD